MLIVQNEDKNALDNAVICESPGRFANTISQLDFISDSFCLFISSWAVIWEHSWAKCEWLSHGTEKTNQMCTFERYSTVIISR